MSLSNRPRRTHSRIEIVHTWLVSPLSRIVPRDTRDAIQWLAEEMTATLTPPAQPQQPPHLARRPAIGSSVQLLQTDPFLEREANAGVGSVGTVVAHSQLNWDDTGVLVDWGNGRSIRSNLDELALV